MCACSARRKVKPFLFCRSFLSHTYNLFQWITVQFSLNSKSRLQVSFGEFIQPGAYQCTCSCGLWSSSFCTYYMNSKCNRYNKINSRIHASHKPQELHSTNMNLNFSRHTQDIADKLALGGLVRTVTAKDVKAGIQTDQG